MKNKMKWMSLIVTVIMLMAAASPVYAQSDGDTGEEPVAVEETNSFLNQPIVKLLANFFGSLFVSDEVEEPVAADPSDTPEPGDGGETGDPGEGGETGDGGEPTEEPTPVPTQSPEEQVAALHTDEDLGFGEITKLLEIVTEAQEACASEGVNCDVTMDSLLAEYKSGLGMGELFKKYGKPEITGVGQVKQELDENGEKIKSNNGKAKGKDK